MKRVMAGLGIIHLFSTIHLDAVEKNLVIVTTSYNNIEWIDQYFNSLISQTYNNWTLIYIDDNSDDGTFERMQSLIANNGLNKRAILIRNKQRHGHLCNQYNAINACDPNSIIIIIDGDDWLAHEHVFEKINQIYQNENIWLTYGQFWYLKKDKKGLCKSIAPEIIKNNAIRTISWRTSHLRTFYAGLFQQIHLADLLYHGRFFPKCADVATMFAMVEMASSHIKFNDEILYIYNDNNPLSFHHDPSEQRALEAYLRAQTPYQPLKEKIW